MTAAVIVAAGRGIRMKTDQDKLFLELAGLPVVGHTWKKFDRHPEIDEIIMVIRDDARKQFEKLAGQLELTTPHSFTVGGHERQDSVINGISAVQAGCDIVAIHDGARPCTSPATISSTIAAAREKGAAAASRPGKSAPAPGPSSPAAARHPAVAPAPRGTHNRPLVTAPHPGALQGLLAAQGIFDPNLDHMIHGRVPWTNPID